MFTPQLPVDPLDTIWSGIDHPGLGVELSAER
jgi:hypothetical protein